MLNKKMFAALSLTLSSFGFAGTMGPACIPGSVTAPCAMQQWDFNIQALYLKPTYSFEQPNFLTTDSESIVDVGGKWSMAFALTGAYHFSTGNDLNLDWTHFDATRNHGPLSLSQATRFDQANLVFGQHIDFDQIKSARFYGGLQYANMHMSSLNSLTLVDHDGFSALPAPSIQVRQQSFADYNGVGPVLGVNFAYAIGSSGFSVTANTATSVLYGTGRAIVNVSANGLVSDHLYSARKMMVPGLEEKLGLNYQTHFAQGQLMINGGYQALNYFNAVTRASSTQLGPKIAVSDFGIFGPYFGVRWLSAA